MSEKDDRDDVTNIDRQDLDPALSAMSWEDTGEREHVVINNRLPHRLILAAIRKLRRKLFGCAPLFHPFTHLLDPVRSEQTAAAIGCLVAIVAGVTASSVNPTYRAPYASPIPLLSTLPQATAYVERVPAPFSTTAPTSSPERSTPPEHTATDQRPTKVTPTPSATPSKNPETKETSRPPTSATPTLKPTPTPEGPPPASSNPTPKPGATPGSGTTTPEPIASVGVDLDELDVDVEVDLGDVEVDLDVDLGSLVGDLTR